MRVIAGRYKGRHFDAVKGDLTRPTGNRVREAWASSINTLRPEGFVAAHVLDAFAGSGALGIEALSRGAASACFVDKQSRALRTIRSNLESLGIDENSEATLLGLDILNPQQQLALARFAPFDLLFLDPPYAYERSQIAALLDSLIKRAYLAADCLISYEHRASPSSDIRSAAPNSVSAAPNNQPCQPDSWPSALEMLSCKRYGDSLIEYHRLAH
jgi:16S rRNA (guanine966-N2)-methyltransferase